MTRPYPEWPAFRDELDAAIRAAEDAGDAEGWCTAVRRRMHYGEGRDELAGVRVGAAFHAALLGNVRAGRRPYPDACEAGGVFVIRRVPITVRES